MVGLLSLLDKFANQLTELLAAQPGLDAQFFHLDVELRPAQQASLLLVSV
jgi:hypothetical protein